MRVYALWLALIAAAFGNEAFAVSQTRTSAFEYDPVSGLLVREIIEPDDSNLCVVTTYTYDAYGNRTSITTRNCNGTSSGGVTEAAAPTGNAVFQTRTSSTSFAATAANPVAGQFSTSTTNALGQVETKEYDARHGAMTRLTGPNGLVTAWSYDGFGRKTLETRADGTQTKWEYILCSAVPVECTHPNAKMVVKTTPLGTDGITQIAPFKRVSYDILNREVRVETQGFDGTIVRKDTQYDSLGRVAQVSQPYYASATAVWTVYTYDILNRVLTTTEPTTSSGTLKTATTYNGLTTLVTISADTGAGTNMPQGLTQTKTTTKNSQGQIVAITDAQSNTLNYAYDPFGNLKTTTDPLGNVTTLTYDVRGRKISSVDPDMGTWSYSYDALGELVIQTDAKGQTTRMQYDVLGRMTSRTEADLVSTWNYDACPMGVGKICSSTADNGYVHSHAYDSLGRPSSVTITIDATYTVSTGYDSAGRISTVIYPASSGYPAGFQTRNVYNGVGYLVEVWDNIGNVRLWQAHIESASGKILRQLLGNGLTTNRDYDPMDRLTSVTTGAGAATDIQNLSYSYDLVGNLIQRADAVDAVTETFAYDTLNRLLSASGPNLVTRSFDYNAIGNMTYKSDVGSYTYSASGLASVRPHAVSSVAGTLNASYTYDANGNLVSGAGRTLTYTAFNLPATIAQNTDSFQYLYNVEHERVKLQVARAAGVYTTVYVHPNGGGQLLFEKEIKPDVTEYRNYINAGRQVIGVFVTNNAGLSEMRYFHTDHLGSLAAITNASGAVMERFAYEPYGKRRYPNGTADANNLLFGVTTDRGFTGHEHLDEIGLIHMNGRVYDPMLGRFMTPDALVQDPNNLQNCNRYSYVLNNPLLYTDPTGQKFKLKQIITIVVVVVVSVYTAGAATEFMLEAAADSFAAGTGGLSTALVTLGGEGGTLTALGSAAAGAAGGFAGGFTAGLIASNGDLNTALKAGAQGAVSGAITGGIDGHYGDSWSLQRVAASSVAGGVSSKLSGGSFADGFKSSFTISALTYMNYSMRQTMVDSSLKNADGRNASGVSAGFFGDGFKLGGSRVTAIYGDDGLGELIGYKTNDGFFGGIQGGAGRVGPIAYSAGGVLDRIVEAFAGPHDFLNSGYWYDSLGNAKDLHGFASAFGDGLNALNVPLASPFAAAALTPSYAEEPIKTLEKKK